MALSPISEKPKNKFAERYKQFRSGKAFFIFLTTFIGTWVTIHFLTGFDSDWGELNLLLSMEASIGMSLFMAISDKQDEMQQKQDADNLLILRTILHVAEATRDALVQRDTHSNGGKK